MKKLINEILSLSRFFKNSLAVILDTILCIFTVWIAFYLRTEEFVQIKDLKLQIIILPIVLVIPIFFIMGLYKTIYRYVDVSIIYRISKSFLIYSFIFFVIVSIFGLKGVPRSIGIIQPILLYLCIIVSRFIIKYLFKMNNFESKNLKEKKNILIYGAGSGGRQLLIAFENNPIYKVVGFIDDNKQLHGQLLLGQKIYNSSEIKNLKISNRIDLILLAIPSISKFKKNEIIKTINQYNLPVKTLPNINDLIDGKVAISDLKDFLIEDLLNRDPVEPNKKLLNKNTKLKTVMITGSGGTIGSELCKQILKLKPKKLILFENNEYALYKIYEKLKLINENSDITPIIGNIQNQKKLEKIFQIFNVDTVYHAAAYKHVPLVEANICEGVQNNVLGTLAVTKAVINKQVKNFVLISSDKAVRPTNVMGATKRFSELCLQVLHKNNDALNFSIVRFGNVLASSGSVIPKFKEQISRGGPVTLTHHDVTRYFMTISEAAQLVIQAGALGKKSEVFLLDMGESIKIKDLINRMIKLSGLKLKDSSNKEGDIEIKIIGLRPGEKLFEELLIGESSQDTIHPKIKKITEPKISNEEFEKFINQVSTLIEAQNPEEVKKLLSSAIKLYVSDYKIVDTIYLEEKESKFKVSKGQTINSKIINFKKKN